MKMIKYCQTQELHLNRQNCEKQDLNGGTEIMRIYMRGFCVVKKESILCI